MERDPNELRKEAADDRRLAEELLDENPSYSGYLEKRAAWKDYLAQVAEVDEEFRRKEDRP